MNKHISKISIIASLVAGIGFSGCGKKFDDINTNPDKPSTASSGWLATNILTAVTSKDISTTKGFGQPFILGKYIAWSEMATDYQYNKFSRANFDRLLVLRDVAPMINNASTPELKNSYDGFGHFVRAWQFFQVTMQLGDVPYSQAIQGGSGVIKAKYDTQKEVFTGILNELDQADALLSKGVDFSGDFIFQGSVDKWRRVVNTFELQVLMSLSKKTTDADLNVVQKFNEVIQRPLMRDFSDNLAVTYTASAGYCYPWSSTPAQINSFVIYPMMATTLVDLLKPAQDRRLFYFAEPATAKIAGGKKASEYEAYTGVEPADDFSTTINALNSGNYCNVNKRYVEMYNAEPVGLLNYWDLQFILAEAAVRGWISGTAAQTYYANGIKSSMSFLAKYAPATYAHGMTMDDAYITGYPATVALTGSPENQIKQIISQKYIAGFFQNADFNAWYENRRTGYPVFTLNSNTNLNVPSTSFPLRWMYPQKELDYNAENVNAAIESQFKGDDDFDQVMWLLK